MAETRADIPQAASRATRESRRIDDQPRGARGLEPAAIPLLSGSPEGLAFLFSPAPRAFALGEPPAACPARVAAAGGADRTAAISAALEGCFAALRDASAPEDCGCRVVAADDSLLGAREDFAYAPGVSAWILAPELGVELHLPAIEGVSGEGERALLIDAAPGIVIAAELRRDGGALVAMTRSGGETTVFTGRHQPEGLRRGRFADRVRATSADGAALTLLSGYEPVEYAVRRRELLGWRPPAERPLSE